MLLISEIREIFVEVLAPFMEAKRFRYLKREKCFIRKGSQGAEYFSGNVDSGGGITPILGVRCNHVQKVREKLTGFPDSSHSRTIVLYCGNQLENPESPSAKVPEHYWEAITEDDVLDAAKACKVFVEEYAEPWFRHFSNAKNAVETLTEEKQGSKVKHTCGDGFKIALAIAFTLNDRDMCSMITERLKNLVPTKSRIEFYELIQTKEPQFFSSKNPFLDRRG